MQKLRPLRPLFAHSERGRVLSALVERYNTDERREWRIIQVEYQSIIAQRPWETMCARKYTPTSGGTAAFASQGRGCPKPRAVREKTGSRSWRSILRSRRSWHDCI